MPGFGNDFETEALPGALPVGQNSPQRTAYGLYAEQLSGSPFTAPRGTNERSWLYRIRPSVQHAQSFKKTALPYWKTAPALGEHDLPIGQLRWSPVPIPKEKLTFLDGHAHHDDGRRRQHAGRHGRARLSRHAIDGERLLLQRRRRDADRAAAGRAALLHRVRQHRGRARRDLRHPARREVQGGADGRSGARLCVRELRRQVHAARPRADRRQLPRQRARFQDARRGLRGQGGEVAVSPSNGAAASTSPSSATRRSTSSPGTATTRPTNTTCGTSRPSARIALRSPRSVDLHGAHRAVGDGRHRQRRFRDLPRALGGGRAHLPPALVSHEHHVGVHGAHLRRLRCQARGLRAGRLSACTTACCRTAPTRQPSITPPRSS